MAKTDDIAAKFINISQNARSGSTSIISGGVDLTASVGDTTAPTLSGTNPADNATDIAINTNIVLTFNENLVAGTGSFTFVKVGDTGNNLVIPVEDAQVTISSNQVTINPTADLDNNQEYQVQYPAGILEDASGNGVAAVADASISFTTVASAFTPIDPSTVSGLQLWIDVDDDANIALTGNDIDSFTDKSSNGYTLALTGSVKAVRNQDATFNNKRVAVFDSAVANTSGYSISPDLAVNTFYDLNNRNQTLFFVFKGTASSGSNDQDWLVFHRSVTPAGVDGTMIRLAENGNTLITLRHSANSTADNSITLDNNVHINTINRDENVSAFWVDGVNQAVTQSSHQDATANVGTFHFGAFGTSGKGLNGSIGELLIYNRTLTTQERQNVEDYLADKWTGSTIHV